MEEGSGREAPSDSGDDGISGHGAAVEVGSGGWIPVSSDRKPPGFVVGRERPGGRVTLPWPAWTTGAGSLALGEVVAYGVGGHPVRGLPGQDVLGGPGPSTAGHSSGQAAPPQ